MEIEETEKSIRVQGKLLGQPSVEDLEKSDYANALEKHLQDISKVDLYARELNVSKEKFYLADFPNSKKYLGLVYNNYEDLEKFPFYSKSLWSRNISYCYPGDEYFGENMHEAMTEHAKDNFFIRLCNEKTDSIPEVGKLSVVPMAKTQESFFHFCANKDKILEFSTQRHMKYSSQVIIRAVADAQEKNKKNHENTMAPCEKLRDLYRNQEFTAKNDSNFPKNQRRGYHHRHVLYGGICQHQRQKCSEAKERVSFSTFIQNGTIHSDNFGWRAEVLESGALGFGALESGALGSGRQDRSWWRWNRSWWKRNRRIEAGGYGFGAGVDGIGAGGGGIGESKLVEVESELVEVESELVEVESENRSWCGIGAGQHGFGASQHGFGAGGGGIGAGGGGIGESKLVEVESELVEVESELVVVESELVEVESENRSWCGGGADGSGIGAGRGRIGAGGDGIGAGGGGIGAGRGRIGAGVDGIGAGGGEIGAGRGGIGAGRGRIEAGGFAIEESKLVEEESELVWWMWIRRIEAGGCGLRAGADSIRADGGGIGAGRDGIRAGGDSIRAGADSIRAGADSIRADGGGIGAGRDGIRAGGDSIRAGADSIRADGGGIGAGRDGIRAGGGGIGESKLVDVDSERVQIASELVQIASELMEVESELVEMESELVEVESENQSWWMWTQSCGIGAGRDGIRAGGGGIGESKLVDVDSERVQIASELVQIASELMEVESELVEIAGADSIRADGGGIGVDRSGIGAGRDGIRAGGGGIGELKLVSPIEKSTERLEFKPEAQKCVYINLPIFSDTLNSSHPSKVDFSRTFHCFGIYKNTSYLARQTFTVADETAPEAKADMFLKHCSQGGKQNFSTIRSNKIADAEMKPMTAAKLTRGIGFCHETPEDEVDRDILIRTTTMVNYGPRKFARKSKEVPEDQTHDRVRNLLNTMAPLRQFFKMSFSEN
ncbi:unnamed protein product [Caenorhabditis nigoni]